MPIEGTPELGLHLAKIGHRITVVEIKGTVPFLQIVEVHTGGPLYDPCEVELIRRIAKPDDWSTESQPRSDTHSSL